MAETTTTSAAFEVPQPSLGIETPVFAASWIDGEAIDVEHTCKGTGTSPALSWAKIPGEIAELAISAVDLDNGQAVQWVIAGINPAETGLSPGVVPVGAVEAKNYLDKPGWAALCPTAGTHRYLFTLYMLPTPSGVLDTMSGSNAISTLDLNAGQRLTLTGTAAA